MSLFRSGSEEAFRAIHDRYRGRMFAYTRQMLSGSSVDAEDAVQEIFVRAYSGLRSSNRELALRAWLYRIAHNRCIDELRRPQSALTETIPATVPNTGGDPVARLEQRDALQRLIADVQRLPEQQRSALLMRELAGMAYADVAGALGVSVPAVKSLLVRARVGLAQASEARDTACARIREDLIVAHDRGVRASGLARRHLRDCPHCRQFRSEVRGVSRQLAAFVPALGPIGVIAKVLGIGSAGGGGAAAGTGAIAGGGATATAAATTAAGGVAGSGAAIGLGAFAGTGHVVTLLAAAVVTAGGALELQHIAPTATPQVRHHHVAARTPTRASHQSTSGSAVSTASPPASSTVTPPATSSARRSTAPTANAATASNPLSAPAPASTGARHHSRAQTRSAPLDLTESLDPDQMLYGSSAPTSLTDPTDQTGAIPVSTTDPSTGSTATPVVSTTGTASSPTTTGTPSTGSSTSTSGSSVPVSSTGTSTPTGTSGTTGSGGSTPSTGSSSTSTGSTGSSQSGGASSTPVRPATSTGSINPAKMPAATKPHGHGTIAVFTMTGN